MSNVDIMSSHILFLPFWFGGGLLKLTMSVECVIVSSSMCDHCSDSCLFSDIHSKNKFLLILSASVVKWTPFLAILSFGNFPRFVIQFIQLKGKFISKRKCDSYNTLLATSEIERNKGIERRERKHLKSQPTNVNM